MSTLIHSFTAPLDSIIGRESPGHITVDALNSRLRSMTVSNPMAGTVAEMFDQLIGGFQPILNQLAKPHSFTLTTPLLGTMVQEQTLTADTQINAQVKAVIGATLVVVLTQDSAGGHTVTWATEFHNATALGSTAANTLSIYTFVGRKNSSGVIAWYMANAPLSGQPL